MSSSKARQYCWLFSFIPTLFVAFLLVLWRPLLLSYFFRYAKLIISEVVSNKQRVLDNDIQIAWQEWKLYELETRFGQEWCEENIVPPRNVTWMTALVNDEYVVPALVLGRSISTFSCYKSMIALISEEVSNGSRKALRNVGWNLRVVEEMDCNWLDKKLDRNKNNGIFGRAFGSRIKGTHTRFHAWNYTQFTKIIYVDADYMLMTNIDELFDIPDDFAAAPCARPGILDPCFNAGLLVFRPDHHYYLGIMRLWVDTTKLDTCPNDQVLLWHFYAGNENWKALGYGYNIWRIVFRPMKSFHFACCIPPKPWVAECRPSRNDANHFSGPILNVDDVVLVFWKTLYKLLTIYKLEDWWRSTKFFRPTQEFSEVSHIDCWKLQQATHKSNLYV